MRARTNYLLRHWGLVLQRVSKIEYLKKQKAVD